MFGSGNTLFKTGQPRKLLKAGSYLYDPAYSGSCPAAFRFALSAARSVFTFDHRAITDAESRRAFAHAAMSRAVGAASAACIVMAAAIIAALMESKV